MDVGTIALILVLFLIILFACYKQYKMIVELKNRMDELDGDGK